MMVAGNHYKKGSNAVVGVVAQALQCLRFALIHNGIYKHAHLTKEVLKGEARCSFKQKF